MSDDADLARALSTVDGYIADSLHGLLTNAQALEEHPQDRHAGARVQSYLVLLDRLYAVRRGILDR